LISRPVTNVSGVGAKGIFMGVGAHCVSMSEELFASILSGKKRHCPMCDELVSTYTRTEKSPALGVRGAKMYVERVTYCRDCGADINRTNEGYE